MDEAEHNGKESSSIPPPMESLNSNDNDTAPSADDLAWADSCLMKFTEASDADWSSFKESLLEMLNVPTEPVSLLTADNGSNDHIELEDNHAFPSGESMTDTFSMMTDDHSDFTDEDKESVQEGEYNATHVAAIGRKKKERLKGKKLIENALLPDHAEFAKVESGDLGFDGLGPSLLPDHAEFAKVESSDLGFDDLGPSLLFEAETSFSDAIFKVWDLGVSDEQDEFTKALNNALGESSSDLAVEPMDDLIAGISELSLGQSSN